MRGYQKRETLQLWDVERERRWAAQVDAQHGRLRRQLGREQVRGVAELLVLLVLFGDRLVKVELLVVLVVVCLMLALAVEDGVMLQVHSVGSASITT